MSDPDPDIFLCIALRSRDVAGFEIIEILLGLVPRH